MVVSVSAADEIHTGVMEQHEIKALLEGLRSRGEIKRFGVRVDREPAVRAALEALAASKGVPPEGMSGKKLVRAVLSRADDAQIRRNPIHRDEPFTCAWCDAAVTAGGVPVRDHCPRCLRSLHVDRVPGDRANGCGGVLHPRQLSLSEGTVHIDYVCGKCGAPHRVRAHPDDQIPPSMSPSDLPGRAPREGSSRSRTLPQRVLGFVRQHKLWAPGQRVLVAVSGGVDSTVLLEVLAQTAGAHGGRLEVASLDHGLRPESADEVALVRAHAERLGLPFWTTRLSLPPGPNLYARGRAVRQEALCSRGADRIATGHHQTDQAETVLHHLLRGSGSRGLRGMQPLSAPWCRPLLDEPREVLEAWARAEGLRWVEDPSNADSQRGALRRLMPSLDTIHGGAVGALARSGRLLAREDALLSSLTDAAWARCEDGAGLAVARLHQEHPAIQLRLLRRLTKNCPKPVRADQLEAFLDWAPQGGGRLPLPAGWALVYRGGILTVDSQNGRG